MADSPVILAYSDRDSVRPGERVNFQVSAEGTDDFNVTFVRLRCPESGQPFPPYVEEPVAVEASGQYPARVQPISAGSSVVVVDPNTVTAVDAPSMSVFVWPTRLGVGRQALLGNWDEPHHRGYGLEIDAQGRLSFCVGDGDEIQTVQLSQPLVERRWQWVGVAVDASTRTATLFSNPVRDKQFPILEAQTAELMLTILPNATSGEFRMAAWRSEQLEQRALTCCNYDGKLDRPRFGAGLEPDGLRAASESSGTAMLGSTLIAAWDFSLDISSDVVSDIGPHGLHGRTVNLPMRAATGANWTGREYDWRHAPEQYGAIHFHSDDLYSAEWDCDFTMVVPNGLRSGVYAARLNAGDAEYYVPFYVRPPRAAPKAKLLFLVPTATYLAYANNKVRIVSAHSDALTGRATLVDPLDLTMLERPELGLSTYDSHADGSAVHYSSRLRPVVNCRPKEADLTMAYNNLACDLLLLDWLEHSGVPYDVMTDEDLHHEGVAALKGYRTVMTGAHPEYYSLAMLDALDEFVREGGRLMYMGGNGFYWRVAFHPEFPGVLEHRRAQQNISRWNPGVGQYFHSFTGEHGGLWWDVGRPPQLLTGVGFIAQGFDEGAPYRIKPAASDPRVAFMFDGVDGDLVGDGGLMPGGNAGIEVDRLAPRRGSPTHALVVASSSGHTRLYETLDETSPDGIDAETGDEAVRADMVYFECGNGGAVFSVGSIGFAFGLCANCYDNNAAKLAGNVLERFLSECED